MFFQPLGNLTGLLTLSFLSPFLPLLVATPPCGLNYFPHIPAPTFCNYVLPVTNKPSLGRPIHRMPRVLSSLTLKPQKHPPDLRNVARLVNRELTWFQRLLHHSSPVVRLIQLHTIPPSQSPSRPGSALLQLSYHQPDLEEQEETVMNERGDHHQCIS